MSVPHSAIRWLLNGLATLVVVGLLTNAASAGTFVTRNFVVKASNREVARQVGEYAEHFRQEKAMVWLGRELPPWEQACTIQVKVTLGGAGGATSFIFDNGQVLAQQMSVEGPLERILHSVLPHEITHTIFAARFRRPLPRWADEGGAVLSEDDQERARHDLLVRNLINNGRKIPLQRLFILTDYPRDVMALYAQGYSIAAYLVSQRGRPAFLDFVHDGQTNGWEGAVRRHYGFRSVADLDYQWIEWLRAGRGTGADKPQYLAQSENAPRQRVVRAQIPDEPTVANSNTNRPFRGNAVPTVIASTTREGGKSSAPRAAQPTTAPTVVAENYPVGAVLGGARDTSTVRVAEVTTPASQEPATLSEPPPPPVATAVAYDSPDRASAPVTPAARVVAEPRAERVAVPREPTFTRESAPKPSSRRLIPIAVGRTRRS